MTLVQTGLVRLKSVSGKLRRMFAKHPGTLQEEPQMPRLLVVDDQESICFSMRDYFQFHGYKVDTASRRDEAERLIQNADYKAIIQDLRLGTAPDPDGLHIVRLAHKRNPNTRIVILTAYGSVEMEDEARRCGADAFLRKPTPLSQVAQVVLGLIESSAKQDVR